MAGKIVLLLCMAWFAGEQASAQTTVSGLSTSNSAAKSYKLNAISEWLTPIWFG